MSFFFVAWFWLDSILWSTTQTRRGTRTARSSCFQAMAQRARGKEACLGERDPCCNRRCRSDRVALPTHQNFQSLSCEVSRQPLVLQRESVFVKPFYSPVECDCVYQRLVPAPHSSVLRGFDSFDSLLWLFIGRGFASWTEVFPTVAFHPQPVEPTNFNTWCEFEKRENRVGNVPIDPVLLPAPDELPGEIARESSRLKND